MLKGVSDALFALHTMGKYLCQTRAKWLMMETAESFETDSLVPSL